VSGGDFHGSVESDGERKPGKVATLGRPSKQRVSGE